MRTNSLFAVLLLAACQTGETPPRVAAQQKPREPARVQVPAQPVVAPPSATGITPMQMVATESPPLTETAAPFTLTASDGSGLTLTRIDAKAVVQGPLAFTELHLYFKNPENRVREGTFAITLPSGAAVSRFAMENDGKWQEAEVVEKQMARRIYDDFLHRKQDPALLEKAAGNQFSAKVFPIPAGGEKHLVLSFSQELAGRGYTLPLRGLPKTNRVDVALMLTGLDGKPQSQALTKRDWQPNTDFVGNVGTPAAAVSSGELVATSIAIAPRAVALGGSVPTELTLLVDTSASRALGFAGYVKSIRDLLTTLRQKYGEQLAVQVVAFDQDSQVIYDGPAAAYGDAQDKLLLARGAAGASDLAQVLAALQAPKKRVVIVTDGVMTAGPETQALGEVVKKLPVARVDVVLAGGIRDERTAATLVRAGLPEAGDVFDLDRGLGTVATGLGETVLTDVAIEIPGATWFYPRKVPAARPGSPLMVYAKMARPTQQLTVRVGGVERTIGMGSAAPALVERAIASAEIEEMENQLATAKEEAGAKLLREEIAKRSAKARVISTQTAMIVLESESDYDRYKIPRTALADILVIGPDGLEQQKRSSGYIAKADPRKQDRQRALEEARSAGVLGTTALQQGGAFASLNGNGDISSGFDDANIYGGLMGNEAGEMQGGFGYGRSGFGPGGGGSGTATIGTGRYGSTGHGSGTGTGYGVGGGRGGMRGRSANVPSVSIGNATVQGDLDRNIIRRYVRRNMQKITYCYEKELLAKPNLSGTAQVQFRIDTDGKVPAARASGLGDTNVESCVAGVIKSIEFPKPQGIVNVLYPFVFRQSGGASHVGRGGIDPWDNGYRQPSDYGGDNSGIAALTGKLAEVTRALKSGNTKKAFEVASKWHADAPGDVLALIALGEVYEKQNDLAQAARIYGSIIDLFPMRADMRRFAGERLERVGKARDLVVDTYRRAVADRPDHATGHRLLAYALVRKDDYAGAFTAILAGVDQDYPGGRFEGADRILREDAGMIAAAYLAHGGEQDAVMAQLKKRNIPLVTRPSTRFIMYWETDSNDVDFHIRDREGGHAWYSNMQLPSGGELYADITTGYGPECFAIQGTPTAGPYKLSINYYSQGPMGYGMGLLQVSRFTGKDFKLEDRPYVVMNDGAYVELGSYQ